MEFTVTGTHLWYYFICPREVWLISHQLTPDEDNDNIVLGRYIDQEAYAREKKSLEVEGNRLDIFHREDGRLVVGEVKKSSRYRESARMQLAYYLKKLKENGVEARGELRFPLEKQREDVILDGDTEAVLAGAVTEIQRIVQEEKPPLPQPIGFCKNCAYAEFCWS